MIETNPYKKFKEDVINNDSCFTRGIAEETKESEEFKKEINKALKKYMSCDWGDTCQEDQELNNNAVINENDRIIAKYKTSKGDIFIITEDDRRRTTILFADEY